MATRLAWWGNSLVTDEPMPRLVCVLLKQTGYYQAVWTASRPIDNLYGTDLEETKRIVEVLYHMTKEGS